MNLKNRCITLDIETFTPSGKPDPSKDIIRYVGIRLPTGKKFIYHISQKEAIQNMISSYPVLVGHNLKQRTYKSMQMGYDIPVMERHGFQFKTRTGQRHILIDTQEIIEKRAKSMMYLDFGRGQLNLRYLAEYFGLETQKGDLDYSMLAKPFLQGEELKQLKKYLEGDLDTTYHLFSYLYDFFSGFMEYMNPTDVQRFKWLTGSAGATAYKIICHQAGIPEVYTDYNESKRMKTVRYTGGYVSKPYKDYVEGDIYCIDFASLYPHMFMGGNLYSPVGMYGDINDAEEEGWEGGEIYGDTSDRVRGSYSKNPGKIEVAIKTLFLERKEVKKQMRVLDKTSEEYKTLDRKQLAIKIVINTMYGISGSPKFKSVYNLTTASDCTAMARRSIKHAREVLVKHGYECLYTDTDSVYVLDPFKNKQQLEALCNGISKKQQASFNIPTPTHDFEIESKIKRMWFFRDDKGEFVKKHYMYETDKGKIKKKGIRLVKGDCSALARELYTEYIESHLRASGEDFFIPKGKLLEWVKSLSERKPELLTKRYRVRGVKEYANTTSIQAQIAFRYGAGEHHLVPNKLIGAGKSKKYAKIEELKKAFGDRWIDAVDYTTFLGDLKNFVNPRERKHLMRSK